MQAKHEVEINGVTYESQPEEIKGSCNGCDSESNGKLCSQLDAPTHRCHGIIWIRKEQTMQQTQAQAKPEVTSAEESKYTVEEVLEAIGDIEGSAHWDFLLDVKAELAKKNNPDYKLYLELKAKFGE